MFIWTMIGKSGSSRAIETMCANRNRLVNDDFRVAIFAGYAGNVHSDTLVSPQRIYEAFHDHHPLRYEYMRRRAETRSAIDICQQHGVPIILFRLLFDPSGAHVSQLEDMDHYKGRINWLNEEIARLGIQYGAFETEAYGDPLASYMRGSTFTQNDYKQTVDHARTAVRDVGRVWGVTPAGTYRSPFHPYMAMAAEIGNHQIGQGTYYDQLKDISEINYPYDIAGMFVSVRKSKPGSDRVFFTAKDVLIDRTEVWKDRAGVMVWVEHEHTEVARAFAEAGIR